MRFNNFWIFTIFLIILVIVSGCIKSPSHNTGSSDPKTKVAIVNSSFSCEGAGSVSIKGFAKNNNDVGMDVVLSGVSYDSAGTRLGQPSYTKITMGPGVITNFEISIYQGCYSRSNNISYKIGIYDATVYRI